MNNTGTQTDQVIAQADALMRRHRVFVAGANKAVIEPQQPSDEDIPVLTEIVSSEDCSLPVIDHSPREQVDAALAAHRQQIEQAVEHWLDKELPHAILKVFDGVADQLIAQLAVRMRTELLPQLLQTSVETMSAQERAE